MATNNQSALLKVFQEANASIATKTKRLEKAMYAVSLGASKKPSKATSSSKQSKSAIAA